MGSTSFVFQDPGRLERTGVAEFSPTRHCFRHPPVACGLQESGSSGVFRSSSIWFVCCAKGVGRCGVYGVREF